MTPTVLVCRLDNIGDVVLTGPAVRAIAARARVVMLASSAGAAAAELLPGVDEVVVFDAPWVGYRPTPVDGDAIDDLVRRLRTLRADAAVVFTSFHQSSLPLALVLRLAGIGCITAISEDYPGSLVDRRCNYVPELHEVEQNLAVAAAAGFPAEPADDLALRLTSTAGTAPRIDSHPAGYVVVHPGASVPARGLPVRFARAVCAELAQAGMQVAVTGDKSEQHLCNAVVEGLGSSVRSLAGQSSTLTELCAVLAGAGAVVCGNTGPAHLAAAVGTPVVELFAPVVPPSRWHPWRVPHRLLGDLHVPCSGCRARTCPFQEQICISSVDPRAVVEAVRELASRTAEVPV
jgi:heptosyltransferase III